MKRLYILKYALLLLLAAPAAAQGQSKVKPIEVMVLPQLNNESTQLVTSAILSNINQNPRYRAATTSTDFETIEVFVTCATLTEDIGPVGIACAVHVDVAYTGDIRIPLDTIEINGDTSDSDSFISKNLYNGFVNLTNDEGMAKVRKRCRDDLIGLKAALADTNKQRDNAQKM